MADYNGRCVEHTVLKSGHRISTAFLVFDHNLMGPGDPILWNTIVTDRNGKERIYGKYRSLIQAKIGHKAAVAVIGLLERNEEKDGSEGGN